MESLKEYDSKGSENNYPKIHFWKQNMKSL